MNRRQLVLGVTLLVASAGILVFLPAVTDRLATGVALVAITLAGVLYLLGGVGFRVGESIAGRRITSQRYRALAQATLGCGLIAVGVDALDAGDPLIAVLALGAGAISVVVARLQWSGDAPSGDDRGAA